MTMTTTEKYTKRQSKAAIGHIYAAMMNGCEFEPGQIFEFDHRFGDEHLPGSYTRVRHTVMAEEIAAAEEQMRNSR